MITIDYNIKKGKGIISGEEFDIIREHFSAENPAAKFVRGRSFMPKRLYAITPTGQFDLGLVGEIQKFLESKDIDTTVNITAAAAAVLTPTTNHSIASLKLPLRDYQHHTVLNCLKQGRGVAVLGTGAGKTLICASLIESFYQSSNHKAFKCLVIVPDLGLVNQTYNDFLEYSVSFNHTRWTGSITPDAAAHVTIANTAILQSKFDENEWVKFVDVLIVDETHRAGKGTELSKIIQQIQTYHKFGFTGTLPEDKMSRWSIIGRIGPVLFEKSSHALREEKHLTSVEVKMVCVEYTTPRPKITYTTPTDGYRAELEFVHNNVYRNRLIKTVCGNFDNNSLILVNHIEHGLILEKELKLLTNKQVYFIQGEVEVEDRDRVKAIMESSHNVVCIAISAIFSTGVNIKNIHMIIFAAGGKSFIRTVQSIGRGLRLHQSKEKLIIIDIADELEYGRKHASKRKIIYQQEQIPYTQCRVLEK